MARLVVTGAGAGIGAALADLLHARGDELVLLARSDARAADLEARYAGATTLVADLEDPGTLNGLGRELTGPVDGLVHVAGVVELGPVAELRLHDWEQQLTVNLVAPAVLTRELLPHLRDARGTVVFVNSGAGLEANPTWAAYAASKFGLRALADSLRAEEAPSGVRVTTVFPGRTATGMQAKVHEQEGRDYDAARFLRPETVAAVIRDVLDLPRDATVPEVQVRPGPRA
jgi:short-subunit dehydrogenase